MKLKFMQALLPWQRSPAYPTQVESHFIARYQAIEDVYRDDPF